MDYKLESMLKIFNLLRKANGLNRERVCFYGLNDLESVVLIHLGMEEITTQKILSAKFKVPKQTINNVIMNLRDKGLVELRTDKDDKRVKNLFLIEEGKKQRSEILVPINQANREMYEDLGEENVEKITEAMELLIDSIGENFKKEDAWIVF